MIKYVLDVKDIEKWLKTLKKEYGTTVMHNIALDLRSLVAQKAYELSI